MSISAVTFLTLVLGFLIGKDWNKEVKRLLRSLYLYVIVS